MCMFLSLFSLVWHCVIFHCGITQVVIPQFYQIPKHDFIEWQRFIEISDYSLFTNPLHTWPIQCVWNLLIQYWFCLVYLYILHHTFFSLQLLFWWINIFCQNSKFKCTGRIYIPWSKLSLTFTLPVKCWAVKVAILDEGKITHTL